MAVSVEPRSSAADADGSVGVEPPRSPSCKVRERLGVVDATVELWVRRSSSMKARNVAETDTEMLQVREVESLPGDPALYEGACSSAQVYGG